MVNNKHSIGALLCVALVVFLGAGLIHTAFGASGGALTMQPGATTYQVGDTVSVKLYENSGSTAVVGADVIVDFSAAKLSYSGVSNSGAFNAAQPAPTVGSGSVEIARVSTTGLTGNQLIETVSFKALASGTAALTYGSGSQVNSASDGSNIVGSMSGASVSLQTPAATPTSPAAPVSTSTPTTKPHQATSSSNGAKSTAVSVSGSNSAAPVSVPNGGVADVSQSVSIEPTTVQVDGVQKIEYYLDGKLVSTQSKAPYTYNVDTTKLTNGSHALLTKTYYTNGSTKASTQHLMITDGLKVKSNSAVWAIVPFLVIVVGITFYFFRLRPRRRPPAPGPTLTPPDSTAGPTTPDATQSNNLDNDLAHIEVVPPPPSTVVSPEVGLPQGTEGQKIV